MCFISYIALVDRQLSGLLLREGEMGLVTVLIYFSPSIIAVIRRRCDAMAIITINLYLGWTGIGWLIVAGSALTSNSKDKRIEKPAAVCRVSYVGSLAS